MKTLAAIDVGTNSFHLIVVKIKPSGNFDVIDQTKEVIRLGEGSGGDIKHISDSAMERGIATLKTFKGIADSHKAEVRAIATSAVREAKNGNEFVKKVKEQANIEIEIVNGFEEARLIYLGILKAVPVFKNTTLAFDIGGGSTEFVVGILGKIKYSMSIKLGAVRLSQKFFPSGKFDGNAIKQCRKWAEGIIYPIAQEIKKYDLQRVVASSGTAMAIGLMIYNQKNPNVVAPRILNNYDISSEELNEIKDIILSKTDISEIKKISGLEPKRSEIITAGTIILYSIIKLLDIKYFTISGMSLREGIVIDTINKFEKQVEVPELINIREESVNHLSNSSNYESKHCKHSALLACKIYDDLRQIHGLNSVQREYLRYAATLHDIGYQIAHSQHHIHSLYIIKNSELLGFTEREIYIIANVARYHRKSLPKETHPDYANMDINSKHIINILSAILRIADSLDRTHTQRIADVETKVGNDSIQMKLIIEKEKPEIELWSLARRKSLFEKVFKKKLVVKY